MSLKKIWYYIQWGLVGLAGIGMFGVTIVGMISCIKIFKPLGFLLGVLITATFICLLVLGGVALWYVVKTLLKNR